MHTFEDWGLGDRCLRGRGEADLERRDRRYLVLERDLDELLPLLLPLLLLLDERVFAFPLSFSFAGPFGDAGFLEVLEVLESADGFFLAARAALPLDALLLREELPDELERLEPEELEPELERLELLLPEDELLHAGKF